MYDEKELLGKLDKEALEKARAEGKKIGLVQGSWDQFHIGHLRYIKKAKENCDYLIVGMDSDAKIQKRKGKNRPLIPQDERYEMIKELGISKSGRFESGKSLADDIVIKDLNEAKWGLIKEVKPDILITITENYTIEEYNELTKICGSVLVLPRQAQTSTSDKLRKKLITNMADKVPDYEKHLNQSVIDTSERLKLVDMEEPFSLMASHLSDSTDWLQPVVAAASINDKWYFGTNQCDASIPKKDLTNRSELFYDTIEHAEINLLKRIGDIGDTDTIYVTLFPCDKCMKVMIDKGIKTIYYLEDHPERNWSKRSHELALKKGIKLICLSEAYEETKEIEYDYSKYKYIYPPNARNQEQLDIMIEREISNLDPLSPDIIDQPILFKTKYWYVSENRFPYEGAERQFLVAALAPIYKIDDMPQEMWDDLLKIWLKMKNEYAIDGGALSFRFGNPSRSGASLTRIHAHIIMPKLDNKVRFAIGGHKTLKRELKIKETNQ